MKLERSWRDSPMEDSPIKGSSPYAIILMLKKFSHLLMLFSFLLSAFFFYEQMIVSFSVVFET